MNVDFKNIYKEVSIKFLITEIILFILILYVIGYFVNKDDPLFMNFELNFLFHLLPIAIITLFYGVLAGLTYFAIFTGVALFIYGSINHTYFLSLLLFLLVFSEFWFYWDKKVKEYTERYNYADEKLRDIARNLLLVKLSHDQLEKFYITKPVSIRKLILDIRNDILSDSDKTKILKRVFDILIANFNLEKAGFFQIDEKEDAKLIAEVGGLNSLDKEDPLVKYAIEDQRIMYISDIISQGQTKYLSVIPIQENQEDVKYLLVVERMPFLNLNLDNLLSINLLMDYVIKDMVQLSSNKALYRRFGDFGVEFLKELERMYEIYNKFKIDSTLVYIYVKGLEETIYDTISTTVRGLDVITKIEFKSQNFQGIAILLPFTDFYGANIFLKRVLNILKEKFSVDYAEKNIKYKLYGISKPGKVLLEFYSFEGF